MTPKRVFMVIRATRYLNVSGCNDASPEELEEFPEADVVALASAAKVGVEAAAETTAACVVYTRTY